MNLNGTQTIVIRPKRAARLIKRPVTRRRRLAMTTLCRRKGCKLRSPQRSAWKRRMRRFLLWKALLIPSVKDWCLLNQLRVSPLNRCLRAMMTSQMTILKRMKMTRSPRLSQSLWCNPRRLQCLRRRTRQRLTRFLSQRMTLMMTLRRVRLRRRTNPCQNRNQLLKLLSLLLLRLRGKRHLQRRMTLSKNQFLRTIL